jgi:hypothetical protein
VNARLAQAGKSEPQMPICDALRRLIGSEPTLEEFKAQLMTKTKGK